MRLRAQIARTYHIPLNQVGRLTVGDLDALMEDLELAQKERSRFG